MMKNIEIAKIDGHPDNPRKDLGDLTELAASIKENGILQNLTVVPWFSSVTGRPADNNKMDGYYIAVIGHRRLAAAKLAGLTEVPCVVANMDTKTQISTMLLENMQRSDLTVYEQAQGFQMMLDLGETIGNIVQKTGFSETTVRRRTKLLALESDSFKSAVERGATLAEFAELDKINDCELKNSVLEKIGTQNFNYALQSAIDKEKSEIAKANLIAQLNTFAMEVESIEGYRYVKYIDWRYGPTFEIPEDAGECKYFYKVEGTYIRLFTEKQEDNSVNTVNEEAERKKVLKIQLEEITNRAHELRFNFIKNYSATKAKKNVREIMEFSVRSRFEYEEGYYADFDIKMFADMLEKPIEDEFDFNNIKSGFDLAPERVLLISTYCACGDDKLKCYDWYCEYEFNQALNGIYASLVKLGYEMSDEEQALLDGTHELLKKDNESTTED